MIVLIAEVDAAGRVATTRCQHCTLLAFYMRPSPATTELCQDEINLTCTRATPITLHVDDNGRMRSSSITSYGRRVAV